MESQEDYRKIADEDQRRRVVRMKKSNYAVKIVKKLLKNMGMTVYEPKVQLYAKDSRAIRFVTDDGDLFVESADGELKRVEVKGLSKYWTCRDDYPFPNIMICNINSFDKAEESGKTPTVYFLVNNDYSNIIIIDVEKTRKYWKKRPDVVDSYYLDNKESKYMIDRNVEEIRFAPIELL